jgi:hypothetical protein
MIKTHKLCAVCNTILSQPKKWEGRLAKRIYGSRYYMPSSDYTLAVVAREYKDKFSYESLLNHAKKHQALSEVDFNDRQLRQKTNEVQKKMMQRAITSQEVWEKVIDKGMDGLENGSIKLSATHLLAAARDKSNFDIRFAGQQMALMDMVAAYASGEKLPEGVKEGSYVIEGELAGGTGDADTAREIRSRAFYQRIAGDAATPRTD